MDSYNFQNVERFKQEEHTQMLLTQSASSQGNSVNTTPRASRCKKGENHTASFQMWLRDQMCGQDHHDQDVNEYCQNFIAKGSDQQGPQMNFTLDLSRNRVFQDRLQHHKSCASPTIDTISISYSSLQILSRISEESQVIVSEENEKRLKSKQYSMRKQLTEGYQGQESLSSFQINDSHVNDEVMTDPVVVTSIPILLSPQRTEQDDNIQTTRRSSFSPGKISYKRSKSIAQFQLSSNQNLNPSSPSNNLGSSPKSRRKSSRLQRSSTLSNEDIYQNIYQKGIVRKAFVKTSKNKIAFIYNQLINRNSLMTFEMKRFNNKKPHLNVKTIKVLYLNSTALRKFAFPKEINSCELLHKAIRAYQKDDSLKKDQLKYPQYPLAYRLEGTDDDLVEDDDANDRQHRHYRSQLNNEQKNAPYSEKSSFVKQSEYDSSDMEQMLDRITLAPDHPVNFSQVYLVQEDISNFEIELQQLLLQNLTIIKIEDIQKSKIFYQQVQQLHTMKDIMKMINLEHSNVYSDCCLRLKFPCLNFADQNLPEKLTIHSLPIQWLEIVKIKDYNLPIMTDLVRRTKPVSQSDKPTDHSQVMKLSQLISPFDKKSTQLFHFKDTVDISHMQQVYPTLYSIEEFDLIRIIGDQRQQVNVSIDFFDFYYIYKVEKLKSKQSFPKMINGYFKKVVQLLLEDYDYHQHTYKKFPLQSISAYKLENDQLFVEYIKNQRPKKTLVFEIDPNFIKLSKNDEINDKQIAEKGRQKIQLIYAKLKFLMEQQLQGANLRLY